MITVTEVSRAARQLGPAAIFAVVVGQGAIVHHYRDVREHTLRPRHQLLHGQPHLWEAVGAPIPGGPFCAKTREKSWSPPHSPNPHPPLANCPALPVLPEGESRGTPLWSHHWDTCPRRWLSRGSCLCFQTQALELEDALIMGGIGVSPGYLKDKVMPV